MRNLQMIDGNKKKLLPKNRFLPLRVNFVTFSKFTLRQKYPGTTGNGHNWEMMCTCSIYIGGICTALCARVFDAQVFHVDFYSFHG